MREIKIETLGDAELKAIEALRNLGLSQRLAMVVVWLERHPGSRQMDLMQGAGGQGTGLDRTGREDDCQAPRARGRGGLIYPWP